MTSWLRHLRALIGRRRLADELAEEIQHHLELRRQQLIDDGMDPQIARIEARRRFGNQTRIREQSHDMWGIRWLDALAQDARHGARVVWRSPGLSLVIVLTIALGAGVNAALFLLLNTKRRSARCAAKLRQFPE